MTKQRKTRKAVNETIFRNGKKLLLAGQFSRSEVAQILGVSTATVGRIALADTLYEMKQQVKEANTNRLKAKKETQIPQFEEQSREQPSEQPSVKPAVNQPTREELHNGELRFHVARMAEALERLADAWESAPDKKRGIFGNK